MLAMWATPNVAAHRLTADQRSRRAPQTRRSAGVVSGMERARNTQPTGRTYQPPTGSLSLSSSSKGGAMPNYDVLIYRDYDSGDLIAMEGARANTVVPELPEETVIAGVYPPLHESKDGTIVISGR